MINHRYLSLTIAFSIDIKMIYRHIFQDFRTGIEPEDFRTTEYADNAPSQARICRAKRGRRLSGKANSAKGRNSSKINPCFTKNAYKPIFLRRQRYYNTLHRVCKPLRKKN